MYLGKIFIIISFKIQNNLSAYIPLCDDFWFWKFTLRNRRYKSFGMSQTTVILKLFDNVTRLGKTAQLTSHLLPLSASHSQAYWSHIWGRQPSFEFSSHLWKDRVCLIQLANYLTGLHTDHAVRGGTGNLTANCFLAHCSLFFQAWPMDRTLSAL